MTKRQPGSPLLLAVTLICSSLLASGHMNITELVRTQSLFWSQINYCWWWRMSFSSTWKNLINDNSTIHYQGQRRLQKQASLAVCWVIGTSCLVIKVLSDLEPYKFRTKLFSYNTFIELPSSHLKVNPTGGFRKGEYVVHWVYAIIYSIQTFRPIPLNLLIKKRFF